MLLGTKLNTTPIALLNVSSQSEQLKAKDIADYEVRMIIETETRLISSGYTMEIYLGNKFGFLSGNKNIIFSGNVVYVYDVPDFNIGFRIEHYVAVLQAASYFYNHGMTKDTINSWLNHIIDGMYCFFSSLDIYRTDISDAERKICKLYEKVTDFRFIDINELEKACKKYKVNYNRIENVNELTFKKIRIGNDNEGWINYKFIKLYLNDNLRIKRAVFGFNKFIYDTEWQYIRGLCFHPHINGMGVACFGNREEDYVIYSKDFHYNFLIELLNETVRSYHPDAPYVNIITLAGSLEILKKKITSVISLANDKKNLDISDYLNYSQSMLRNDIVTCPVCYGVLAKPMPTTINEENPSVCANITCKASLKYEKLCTRCEQALTIKNWNDRNFEYNWECLSSSCAPPPLPELPTPESTDHYYCRVCNGVLIQNSDSRGYFCNNINCQAHDIYQWSSGGTIVRDSETALYNARIHWLVENEGVLCDHCDTILEWDGESFECPERTSDENHTTYTISQYADMAGVEFGTFNI